MKKSFPLLLLSLIVFVSGAFAQSEQLLVHENFQLWTGFTATTSTPGHVVNKTTLISNESLVYTMHGVSVLPTSYAVAETTNILSTAGCLKMMKNTEILTEGTPMSIEISPLASITKIWFVECTTGSNRGFQVWKKSATDADWVSIHNAVCNPSSGMAVNLNINAENVALKFTNLAVGQYAFLSDLKIWGNVSGVAIPPVVNSITPSHNSIIPTSGSITVVFSENVLRATGDIRIGNTIVSESDIHINNQTVTIQYSGLNTDSSYEFTIPAGAFKNAENTPTASETKAIFKTPDTILPTLTKLSVAEEGSVLPVNGFISLVMSEACQGGSAAITIGTKSITAGVSASNTNLIYINYSGLAYDTEYTVTIPPNAITDLSGNSYQGKTFTFRTEVDAKGDLLLNFIPDAVSVPSSTAGNLTKQINSFSLEFGGVASAGARNAATYTYSFKCNYVQLPELPSVGELNFYIQSGGGTTPQEFFIQKLAADGVTWNTIETFILGNNDRNTIKSAAAQSSVPTKLRLMYNSAQFWFYDVNVFAFATNSPVDDGQIPSVVSSMPTAQATDVAINGNIKLVFSENVRIGNGNISLDGKTLTAGVIGKNISLSYNNLKYSTNYTLNIAPGAFKDEFNNNCEAFQLSFTTKAKPAVTPKLFDFVVASDGSGNDTTIQSAFNAVPLNNASTFIIFVKNGTYNEYPTLAASKNNVSLIGQSQSGVIVTGNRRSGVDGYTTSTCQTMEIMADNFYCENVTVQNTAGVGAGQAVALKVYADKAVFKNVRLEGYQDTHLTSNIGTDRQYYLNCNIRGTVDFIFGNGVCYFDNCLLYLEDRNTANVIVAPSTSAINTYGYVFGNCTIDGAGSQDGIYNLGRPWQNAPRAVYLNTKMNIIPSAGAWGNMSTIPALFAEFGSVNASNYPVDVSGRNKTFSYTDANSNVITGSSPTAVLSESEAANYTIANVLSGSDAWDATVKVQTTASPSNLSVNADVLSWDVVDGAICYIVAKNGVVSSITTSTNVNIDNTSVYSITAVSEYGALSLPTIKNVTSVQTIETIMPSLKSTIADQIIEFNHAEKIKTIDVFNVSGEKLFSGGNQQSQLSVTTLKSGFYLANLTTFENQKKTFKFVKK